MPFLIYILYMKGCVAMGKRGLTLRVNPLFLLITLVFILAGMLWELLIAYFLVIIHEFSHVITAHFLGFKMNSIELFPFGGMAEYSGLLEMEPKKEFKVALAGPLTNLGLFLVFYIFVIFDIIYMSSIMELILKYNLIIASINLIPALPLDGGRILRSFLIQVYGIRKGNQFAIKIAKFFAIIGILTAILILLLKKSNIWFLFFFFFVYALVCKEEKQQFYYFLHYLSQRNSRMEELSIKKMSAQVVSDTLSIKDAITCINPLTYNMFFVLGLEKKLLGIISEATLIRAYFNQEDKDIIMKDIL